jgi:hypothetical protein
MLVAEKTVGLPWISVRDRLPFDGHVLLSAVTQIPIAWLKLPSTPSDI